MVLRARAGVFDCYVDGFPDVALVKVDGPYEVGVPKDLRRLEVGGQDILRREGIKLVARDCMTRQ